MFFILPWTDTERKRKQPRTSVLHKDQNNIEFIQMPVIMSKQTEFRNLQSWFYTEDIHVYTFIFHHVLVLVLNCTCSKGATGLTVVVNTGD